MKTQMLIIVFLAGALFCKAQSIERDVVASIPNYDIVDWMLVELRDANNAPSATPATIIAQQAAFVLKDGSVVGWIICSIIQSVSKNLLGGRRPGVAVPSGFFGFQSRYCVQA